MSKAVKLGDNVMFEESDSEFVFRVKKDGDLGLSSTRKSTLVGKSGGFKKIPGHDGFGVNLTVTKKLAPLLHPSLYPPSSR